MTRYRASQRHLLKPLNKEIKKSGYGGWYMQMQRGTGLV